ncbi:MAG TPA: hotdog fold domain-containing protein [Burkholderiaceae bacterium]|jgi:acyl-coenzyme A thioesterase PaaI-like protein|nr:hotdog fold domain-containing protein [Burkholderiaceae bacterium]
MSTENSTLNIWERFAPMPGGKWLFARLICFKAPYFGSIRPRFHALRSEYCEVSIVKRRAVTNHLGTVHAIAMCNMAEVAGGIMTEVTVPPTHRWIPKGMTVEYLKKAGSDLVAIATPEAKLDLSAAGEYKVKVIVRDKQQEPVFQASITMWVSPKKATI